MASIIAGILFMGFGLVGKFNDPIQNGMKYDGTYSLYVSYDSGMTIHWITNLKQKGKVIVSDENGNTLKAATTEASRVHRLALEEEPKSTIKLEFGGEESGTETVRLRRKMPLQRGVYSGVDSIYVVGDVHGRYDEMKTLLINAGVVDSELRWQAGKAHLVFLGDLFDRGDDVTKVLWFIHELEPQAEKQGGKVHLVLGNHEIMTMTNDLRYLSRKEKNLSIAYEIDYDEMFHPTNSYLGFWLTSKASVIKIDDLLMAHGGVVDLGTPDVEEFNGQVNAFMMQDMYLDILKDRPDSTAYDPQRWLEMKNFFYNDFNPFWYRGYVLSDTLDKQLSQMLKKYKSKIHVVAHTPVDSISEKYNGKLLCTDLKEAATELLFVTRKKRKYTRYKIDLQGLKTEL